MFGYKNFPHTVDLNLKGDKSIRETYYMVFNIHTLITGSHAIEMVLECLWIFQMDNLDMWSVLNSM